MCVHARVCMRDHASTIIACGTFSLSPAATIATDIMILLLLLLLLLL